MPEDYISDWWSYYYTQDGLTPFPPITLSYVTGRAVSARIYKAGGSQQAGIDLVELQDTGEYAGWLNDSYTAGEYLVVFYDGALKIASGRLKWDGYKELTAAAEILNSAIEGPVTVAESLRLHNAVLGGRVSGAGSANEVFKSLDGERSVVSASVDEAGNRLAVQLDLSD
jgi:hypothetical protein